MDFRGYQLENTWESESWGGIIRSNRKPYQSPCGPPNRQSIGVAFEAIPRIIWEAPIKMFFARRQAFGKSEGKEKKKGFLNVTTHHQWRGPNKKAEYRINQQVAL